MIVWSFFTLYFLFLDTYDDSDDSDHDPNFNPAEYSDTDDDLPVNDAVDVSVPQSSASHSDNQHDSILLEDDGVNNNTLRSNDSSGK